MYTVESDTECISERTMAEHVVRWHRSLFLRAGQDGRNGQKLRSVVSGV